MRSRDKLGLLIGLVAIVAMVYLIKGWSFAGVNQPSQIAIVSGTTPNIVTDNFDLMNDARSAVDIIKDSTLRKISKPSKSPRAVTRISGGKVVTSAGKNTIKSGNNSGIYIVQSGDSLSEIASKVYGSNGTNQANVEKIFQANKDVLKSPNVVKEGQELRIPPVSKVALKEKEQGIVGGFFDKLMGNKQVTTLSATNNKYVDYRVKEGDSLYKIAKKQLGDGNRYKEIKSINKNTLGGGVDLQVGAILKLPRG